MRGLMRDPRREARPNVYYGLPCLISGYPRRERTRDRVELRLGPRLQSRAWCSASPQYEPFANFREAAFKPCSPGAESLLTITKRTFYRTSVLDPLCDQTPLCESRVDELFGFFASSGQASPSTFPGPLL